MRVAELCPVCATFINASCIIYNGDYLPSILVEPLESLDSILEKINDAFTAQTGDGPPDSSVIGDFIGQHYIDTNGFLYVALSNSVSNWALVGALSTTTSTTTAAPTTTSTTTGA